MRVVIIVPDCGEGGLFQFYNQVLPALSALADLHVIFASPTHSPLEPAIPGATCHHLKPENAAPLLARLLSGPLGIAPHLARALAVAHQAWARALTLMPDCVEVCDWPLAAVPAVLDGSVPSIVQCHGSMAQIAQHDLTVGGEVEAMLLRLIEPQVLGLAQVVQTYSAANASFWEGATGRGVEVIRPAYGLTGSTEAATHHDGVIRVFGRLQAWKGPHILAGALHRLGKEAPICEWFGGVKPWPCSGLPTNEQLARDYPEVWNRSLSLHAPVARPEVARLMSLSRAIVVPSTWDVFNFTAVEAMALARPVIVSQGAGASELIEDGRNGFTFAADDPAALADAVIRLQALPHAALSVIGQSARETVRRELDPARIAARRFESYQAAIKNHRQSKPMAASDWLSGLLSPQASDSFEMRDFLGTLPARSLLRAVGDRLYQKIFGKS
jgi:glycosyltransferase involved in cell wall biosynthesis